MIPSVKMTDDEEILSVAFKMQIISLLSGADSINQKLIGVRT